MRRVQLCTSKEEEQLGRKKRFLLSDKKVKRVKITHNKGLFIENWRDQKAEIRKSRKVERTRIEEINFVNRKIKQEEHKLNS